MLRVFEAAVTTVQDYMYASAWKTKVLEAKAFSAHLRRFFAKTKPLEFGRKKTNIIILKSEIKWGLSYAH
jgi:hypothetical protein